MNLRLTSRRGLALAAVAAVAAAGALVAPSAASAAPPCTGQMALANDIDGDDLPDTVVGMPTASGNRGAVDVKLTEAGNRVITSSAAGVAPRAGDRFGASVTTADVDRDGCDDLIIGAPGAPGGGYVAVILGSNTGLQTAGRFVIKNPSGIAGEEFGAAVETAAADAGAGITDTDVTTALWVGAPFTTVSGKAGAGQLHQYALTVGSAGGPVAVVAKRKVNVNSAGGGARAASDDRLGEILTTNEYGNTLYAGIPRRDVAGNADAGAYLEIQGATLNSHYATAVDVAIYTQGSDGVGGKPAAGDRFGASIAAGSGRVAVGAPGEDVTVKVAKSASKKAKRRAAKQGRDVGAVHLIGYSKPTIITQNSKLFGKAVPGSNARGDRFGAALAWGQGMTCSGQQQLLVGIPGKDVKVKTRKTTGKGKKKRTKVVTKVRKDAGAVVVLGADQACTPRLLVAGKRLPGSAVAGDRVGTSLSPLRDRASRTRTDQVVIGVPGKDVGGKTNAGVVVTFAAAGIEGPVTRTGGPVAGLGYGTVLASGR